MNAPVNTLHKLPIGIQSFKKCRSEGFLYVDKTPFVFRLAQAGIPCFLSRPISNVRVSSALSNWVHFSII